MVRSLTFHPPWFFLRTRGGGGGANQKASSGQAASVSSASSSVLRMGQGLGFGRVERRASSQGYFLWNWSSSCGSSSASMRGRFCSEA